MGKLINMNLKENTYNIGEVCTLKEYISIRENFINYGKWLEKKGLKDTILNYNQFLLA